MNAEINGVLRLCNMKFEFGEHKVVNELFKGGLQVKSIFQIEKGRCPSPRAVIY